MANQKRPLNDAQAARKAAQSRRRQPATAAAGKATASRAAGGASGAGASAGTSSGQAANGTTAGGRSAGSTSAGGQAARRQSGGKTATPASGRQATGGPAARTVDAQSAAAGWMPRWMPLTALALSVIGLGLSIYLTIAHLAGPGVLICSSKGLVNCEAVTTSPESKLFGVFPVAELGLAFYFFMTVVNLPWLWRPVWRWLPARGPLAGSRLRSALPAAAWRVRLGAIILGVLFILYLVYTELITLRTICLWCTYVHITTFVLFVILVTQATFWGSPAKAAAASAAGRRTR